jgi:hypothetical protein
MVLQRTLVGLGLLLACSQSWGWGAKGHEIVSYVGAASARGSGQAFWQANVAGMAQLSTVPDRIWKAPSTKPAEASNHWFQVDHYFKTYDAPTVNTFPKIYSAAVAQFGADVIIKQGTAPWRIAQLYQDSVNAFRVGNKTLGMEYAGTMSHYIGDLSQPLHVSENYDGQNTGNTGIHAFFETGNIQDEVSIRQRVMVETQQYLANPEFAKQASGDLMTIIFNEIARSIAWRDTVLQNDTKYGRTSAQGQAVQLQLAVDRMADGAAVLAVVLTMLSNDVGMNMNATPVPIQDPSWFPNEYMNGRSMGGHSLMTPYYQPRMTDPDEDDCGAR